MEATSYRSTKVACYLGYITQAISINLLPLLYVTFQKEFSVSLAQLGMLVTVLFVVQIIVDLLAARFGKNLSYRYGSVISFVLAALGLAMMCVLPSVMDDPYTAIFISSVVLSVGGGMTEVLISPIVDAIPEEGKVGEMSLLHSFYCWGVVAVIAISTAYFALVGIDHWRWLMLLWTIIPVLTAVLFCIVPLPSKPVTAVEPQKKGGLLRNYTFWLFLALMVCSGATELGPAQWASFFAEHGLHIPKAVGDLLGPCALALFQGVSRVVFARLSNRYNPRRLLAIHAVGCVAAYGVIVLSPWPFASLLAFCVCGWCVGPMWPGLLSLSSQRFPSGGNAMFALLALCGDVGCASAPYAVGAVTDFLVEAEWPSALAMRGGFAVCTAFPIMLLIGFLLLRRCKAKV